MFVAIDPTSAWLASVTVAGAKVPTRDAIADSIRALIVSGRLKPGERIREEEIAAEHGVSRVPVREALRRLEAEGYVELIPYQGASVAVPSRSSAMELMQVRRALEVLAARLAAASRGGGLAQQLEQVTHEGLQGADRSERERHPDLVEEFHDLVARASGNQQLVELLDQLRTKVRWVFAMDLEDRATLAWHDHDEVLEAILRGDVAAAGELMDAHVMRDEMWFDSQVDFLGSAPA